MWTQQTQQLQQGQYKDDKKKGTGTKDNAQNKNTFKHLDIMKCVEVVWKFRQEQLDYNWEDRLGTR